MRAWRMTLVVLLVLLLVKYCMVSTALTIKSCPAAIKGLWTFPLTRLRPLALSTSSSVPWISSETHRSDISSFPMPKHYQGMLDHIVLPRPLILQRVKTLATEVSRHYEDKDVVLLCVLNGAAMFFSDFLQAWMELQTGKHSRRKTQCCQET